MSIDPHSNRTMRKVFNVLVSLAQDTKDDILMSRSQAKRLLARCDLFNDVTLDFTHVKQIGQAFADEIFRVFQKQNPDIRIDWVNTNKEVEKMIKRALQRD